MSIVRTDTCLVTCARWAITFISTRCAPDCLPFFNLSGKERRNTQQTPINQGQTTYSKRSASIT